jgi:hypothetical protein
LLIDRFQRMISSYNVGGGGGGHDHASGVRAWPHDMSPVLVPDPSIPKSPSTTSSTW